MKRWLYDAMLSIMVIVIIMLAGLATIKSQLSYRRFIFVVSAFNAAVIIWIVMHLHHER